MTEKKWKDALLKSSLPLEHTVATRLAKLKWLVWGQFPYARNNESGTSVDFSVDLEVSKEYSNKTHWLADLKVLIECKYTSPGARWLFLPYPPNGQIADSAIHVFDQAANKRVTDRRLLYQLEKNLQYCIRGVSIHENGVDEIAIHRGTTQLRYAMPHIVSQVLYSQATDIHDEDLNITISCAILVTTAPVYVLNKDVTVDHVHHANDMDALMTEVEALILWEPNSPDRAAYTNKIIEKCNLSAINDRIKNYAAVFQPTAKIKYPPNDYDVISAFLRSGDHVIVISLKNLESFLKRLDKAAFTAVKSIEHIAKFQYDAEKLELMIGPNVPISPE